MVTKKKYWIIGLITCMILLMAIVSSQPPVTTIQNFPLGYQIVETHFQTLKMGENVTYAFYLYNQSTGLRIDNTTAECHFYLADSQGEILIYQNEVYNPEGYWYSNISGEFLSEAGWYYYGVDCQDGYGGALSGVWEVTQTGEIFSVEKSLSNIAIIFFFFIMIFVYYTYLNTIDSEKKYHRILETYQNKNYIKFVLNAISYNIFKEKFVCYYLLGIPIMIMITQLAYVSDIFIVSQLLNVLSSIYLWFSVIVAIVLFSHVQEWIVNLIENIKDMDWGIQ